MKIKVPILQEGKTIKSVNLHFTSICNYKCRFCFAHSLSKSIMDLSKCEQILNKIKALGLEKINFVGGEPMTHPLIFDMARCAKNLGFTVCITTNGSLLNKNNIEKLSSYVDWIGLSVDSNSNDVEKELGRGFGNHVSHSMKVAGFIHDAEIRLKINTTITKQNYKEDLHSLIKSFNPERWKVFQMLHIIGQNDSCVDDLSVTKDEFEQFIRLHGDITLAGGAHPVFENNDTMINSYLMISPDGNIILNKDGRYSEIPLDRLTNGNIPVILNEEKYLSRKALYDWKRKGNS